MKEDKLQIEVALKDLKFAPARVAIFTSLNVGICTGCTSEDVETEKNDPDKDKE